MEWFLILRVSWVWGHDILCWQGRTKLMLMDMVVDTAMHYLAGIIPAIYHSLSLSLVIMNLRGQQVLVIE
jgi:hypothetical protein